MDVMVPLWVTHVYLVGAGLVMLFVWAQNFYTGSRDSGLMAGAFWFPILLAIGVYWAAILLRRFLDRETLPCTRSN